MKSMEQAGQNEPTRSAPPVESGDLRSSLGRSIDRKPFIEKLSPEERQKAKEIFGRIPHWAYPKLLEFLEEVPPGHEGEAAQMLVDLGGEIANSPDPRATLLHVFEEVKNRLVN